MVIVNGFIRIGKKSGGGLDQNGYPVQPTYTYGPAVPCQWIPVYRNNLATSNDEPVTDKSYTILLNLPTPDLTGERIALFDKHHTSLGEYSVRACEVLRAVNQMKVSI